MCVYTTQPAASIPPSRFSIGRTFLFIFMCLESTIWLMAVSFSHLTCLPALYMRSCRFAHNYRLIISSSVDSGRYASSLFHMYSVWCDAVQYAVFLLCCPYSLLLFLCIIVVGFDILGVYLSECIMIAGQCSKAVSLLIYLCVHETKGQFFLFYFFSHSSIKWITSTYSSLDYHPSIVRKAANKATWKKG